MSKALRIATEDCLTPPPLLSMWHRFHAIVNGSDPPCFSEFMKFMDCSENKKLTDCNVQYTNLLNCLRKYEHHP